MNKISVELETPIKYSPNGGADIDGSFIEIPEPTGKVAHLAAILKSEIGAATKKSLEGVDLSKLDTGSDDEESDPLEVGESAFAMLTMGGSDMQRVMTTFKELLRQTATLAGDKAFTAPMFDRMSYSDVENCLKSYIGNFLKA